MNRFSMIGRRLTQAIPSIIGIIIVTFLLTRALPGDPAVYFAGPAADEQSIAEVRAALGLDKSLPEQFWLYLGDLARGDLGGFHQHRTSGARRTGHAPSGIT